MLALVIYQSNQALAREVEAWDDLALHCFEIDLFETDAAAGDEFVFGAGVYIDLTTASPFRLP